MILYKYKHNCEVLKLNDKQKYDYDYDSTFDSAAIVSLQLAQSLFRNLLISEKEEQVLIDSVFISVELVLDHALQYATEFGGYDEYVAMIEILMHMIKTHSINIAYLSSYIIDRLIQLVELEMPKSEAVEKSLTSL